MCLQIAAVPETLLILTICELERRALLSSAGGCLDLSHQEVRTYIHISAAFIFVVSIQGAMTCLNLLMQQANQLGTYMYINFNFFSAYFGVNQGNYI